MDDYLSSISSLINNLPDFEIFGKVTSIKGMILECAGGEEILSVGSKCNILTRNNKKIPAEVVGFKGNYAMLMPYAELEGVGVGCKVEFLDKEPLVYPDESWLGRVIRYDGEPIDQKGILKQGSKGYSYRNTPPPAHARQRVGKKIDLGIKAINIFTSCCYGQRIGIFAGSGVGKSVLISMITKYAQADIKVIGLIGERGREVQEFLHEYLGEEGLKSAIVIVATGDESPLARKQAAYLTMTVAEYFRDIGKNVLCIMDNVTRFSMAQREIGLSIGEPPSSKGYTPTVFSELPKLLERAGPGVGDASITGLFAVLVEGDDHNEPISDAARGILDGHIVLDRSIAERGRLPAINILRSVSRTMPGCNSERENMLVSKAKRLLAIYNDMAEMIRLGAYRKGSDASVDEAIYYNDKIEEFLKQAPKEAMDMETAYKTLAEILEIEDWNS
ncbi:MAG: flagellar protein export ATPase FliI [Alphaproteobacteria bacterium]